MAQGFERLRHDAIVRRNDKDDDVRDVRTARAHGAERRVAGRVQERDLRDFFFAFRMWEGNRVRADVLRDAAGLARRDVRLADHVEQRSFAVVNVTHDRDHRRAGLEILGLVVQIHLDFFHRRVNHAAAAFAFFDFEAHAVFGANFLGHGLFNRLVDGGEDARFHQVGDDLEGLLLELIGQFAHHDRRLDADDLRIGGQGNFGLRRLDRLAGAAALGRERRAGARAAPDIAIVATTVVAAPDKISAASRFRTPGGAGRQFHTADFFARSRRTRTGGQIDEADFFAHLGQSGRGRFGRGRRRDLGERNLDHRCGCRCGFRNDRRDLVDRGHLDHRRNHQRNRLRNRLRFGRGDDDHRFMHRRRGRGYHDGGGVQLRVIFADFVFEVLGGDLVERARRHLGGGNVQRFGLGQDNLVIQAELF